MGDESASNRRPSALAAAFAAVIVVGTLIGFALSRTIVAPMFRLADAVQAMHPDRPSPGFASEFQDDEVGLVARRLESAMERSEAFVERERRFASHELRTPVF